jgi:hypothetical protein
MSGSILKSIGYTALAIFTIYAWYIADDSRLKYFADGSGAAEIPSRMS